MIGIIAAMNAELQGLIDELGACLDEKKCGVSFFVKDDIVLAICGVGKVNAAITATIMIEHYECKLIINTGIAGGIKGVKTKDIVLGEALMYHDVDATAFQYSYGQIPGLPKMFSPDAMILLRAKQALKALELPYVTATIYSGDTFVSNLDILAKVDTTIPCITEMEGAAIAQVCVKAGVDFLILRYVSDIVGSENQIEDYAKFENAMAERSWKICLKLLSFFG